MYLAIIVLPLLGSIVSGFLGRKVGISGAQLVTTLCVILTMMFAAVTFFEVGLNNLPVFIQLFTWIDSESLNVFWGFNFDSLTVSMLIPVLIVSSLVHLYSLGYMSHDPHIQRFFSYLSLFTFMMIILVTANNFLLMFVGWEGVGICSYLLVSFWFTRIAANQSSLSALLTNRVGDCFLTIGMFALLWSFGNLDYSTVFSLAPYINETIITLIGICLLIGAMAKSSQVGLHVWLPQAMEGPTPVSALIHAATMVTAGVYLLMRCSPLIEYSPLVLMLSLWIGAITTVFSSLVGVFQQDIKKVIAYSTMSQLGMMVIAVGLSSYTIALFHLVNHAFYKALLFLAAGAVIHAVSDNQDFRRYGGLRVFLPLTYSVMLIASLSLVAFPFMTGFYSKDLILESAYGGFCFSSIAVYFISTIGAMFTTLYSVKVLYLTFLTNPAGPVINYKNAHEGDIYMSLPLIILAFFSIYFGYITKDIFIGLGSGFFTDNGLFIHPSHETMLDTEFAVPSLFKLMPLIFTVTLTVLSLIIFEFFPKLLISFKLTRFGYNIFSFFNQRFYIELFYNKYITDVVLKLGGQTTKVLDKGSVELIGPFGLQKGLLYLSNSIASLDTGVVTSYALYILIGLIFYTLIPYIALNNLLVIIFFGLLTLTFYRLYTTKQSDYKPFKAPLTIKQSSITLDLAYHILLTTPLMDGVKQTLCEWKSNLKSKIVRFIAVSFIYLVCYLLLGSSLIAKALVITITFIFFIINLLVVDTKTSLFIRGRYYLIQHKRELLIVKFISGLIIFSSIYLIFWILLGSIFSGLVIFIPSLIGEEPMVLSSNDNQGGMPTGGNSPNTGGGEGGPPSPNEQRNLHLTDNNNDGSQSDSESDSESQGDFVSEDPAASQRAVWLEYLYRTDQEESAARLANQEEIMAMSVRMTSAESRVYNQVDSLPDSAGRADNPTQEEMEPYLASQSELNTQGAFGPQPASDTESGTINYRSPSPCDHKGKMIAKQGEDNLEGGLQCYNSDDNTLHHKLDAPGFYCLHCRAEYCEYCCYKGIREQGFVPPRE